MPILAVAVVVGVAVGYLAGGRIQYLETHRFRAIWILPFVLGAQLALQSFAPFRGAVAESLLVWGIWIPLALVSVVISALNGRAPGMALIAIGLSLNLLVVAANGGMPVLLGNIPIGAGAAMPAVSDSWLHVTFSSGVRLPCLGDVIPIPGPRGFRGLASLGDLILALGVVRFLVSHMHPPAVVPGLDSGKTRRG